MPRGPAARLQGRECSALSRSVHRAPLTRPPIRGPPRLQTAHASTAPRAPETGLPGPAPTAGASESSVALSATQRRHRANTRHTQLLGEERNAEIPKRLGLQTVLRKSRLDFRPADPPTPAQCGCSRLTEEKRLGGSTPDPGPALPTPPRGAGSPTDQWVGATSDYKCRKD